MKQKISNVSRELRKGLTTNLITAFSVIAGLAWNEAVKAMIDYLLPLNRNTILAKFIYAAIMTVVVVFITNYLIKIFESGESESEKEKVIR